MGASGCISGAGVQVGTGGTNHHVVGNYIYNIGLAPSAACNQTHGIYVLTNSNTIQANVIFNCEDLGIQIDGNGPSNNIVTNNTIFGNWRGIVVDSGDGGSNTATGNVISNNIVYNNLGAGIYDGADGPVSGNIISNNLIDGNSPNLSLSGDTASNTITANPDFVNYTGDDTGNYQLAATSPAYHAGTNTDAPATDAAGNAYNNPPSLGAYE
jgi:parallel beta-helix repeat protein